MFPIQNINIEKFRRAFPIFLASPRKCCERESERDAAKPKVTRKNILKYSAPRDVNDISSVFVTKRLLIGGFDKFSDVFLRHENLLFCVDRFLPVARLFNDLSSCDGFFVCLGSDLLCWLCVTLEKLKSPERSKFRTETDELSRGLPLQRFICVFYLLA